jgi:excisionase family DNA binding protein
MIQFAEPKQAAYVKGAAGIADYCGVSRRTAQTWLSNGLKATRLTARLVLVKTTDLEKFIEAKGAAREGLR